MLTSALRIYVWDRSTSSISSDRLEDETLPSLERAVGVYRRLVHASRGQVRNAARVALAGLRPDRVEPVVKLLDDVATYVWPHPRACSGRRIDVFLAAAREHPILDPVRAGTLAADVLGPDTAPPAPAASGGTADRASGRPLAARLYADYPEFHILTSFPVEYGAEALRADYDLAQAQALLYAATRVTVAARQDFKHILRYARLAQLLHRLERTAEGYRFVLDGPNSVLRRTRVYGVAFARFLAALVRARDWTLAADIELRKGWRPLTFRLADTDGLGAGRARPAEFDSSVEERFARTFGAERGGWRLYREAVVLDTGGALFVPDFVFRHTDGTEALLEIVGFWTPEYLEDKLRKLRGVRGRRLLVAVPKRLALRSGTLPGTVVPFARRLRAPDVLAKLEHLRTARHRR